MKYLLIRGYPGIAIPLEALAACGGIRFVGSKSMRDEKGDYQPFYWEDKVVGARREAEIIDDSQILNEEPKEKEEE